MSKKVYALAAFQLFGWLASAVVTILAIFYSLIGALGVIEDGQAAPERFVRILEALAKLPLWLLIAVFTCLTVFYVWQTVRMLQVIAEGREAATRVAALEAEAQRQAQNISRNRDLQQTELRQAADLIRQSLRFYDQVSQLRAEGSQLFADAKPVNGWLNGAEMPDKFSLDAAREVGQRMRIWNEEAQAAVGYDPDWKTLIAIVNPLSEFKIRPLIGDEGWQVLVQFYNTHRALEHYRALLDTRCFGPS